MDSQQLLVMGSDATAQRLNQLGSLFLGVALGEVSELFRVRFPCDQRGKDGTAALSVVLRGANCNGRPSAS
jgi:hypothetical protein